MLVAESLRFGRVLMIDGTFQTTEGDEFVYHEMLAHVPLMCHPRPSRVLVVGGGDGGTVREIFKHWAVENVELVEIDKVVIEASKRFLPSISSKLGEGRLKIITRDAADYVKKTKKRYDVVLVDSTDPVGPAVRLFSEDFFKDARRILKDDGILVSQTESPFLHKGFIARLYKRLGKIFPIVKPYTAPVPTYPSGLWSFTACSKKYDPPVISRETVVETRYYTPEIHRACFSLPRFLEDALNPRKKL